MTVNETMLGRIKKLLRVKFDIRTATVTGKTALGSHPIGFAASFIESEFRLRVNDWFEDLIQPFASVPWDEGTSVDDLSAAILNRSTVPAIKKANGYRAHVLTLAESAFDNAAGEGSQTVPVADRPAVQQSMNEQLESSLLRDISLDDLAGDRATILSNVTDRMVI